MELNKTTLDLYNKVRFQNNEVLSRLSTFLELNPKAITAQWMLETDPEGSQSPAQTYSCLLAAFCGLDPAQSAHDYELLRNYFLPAVHRLSATSFYQNPYFQQIKFPEIEIGEWSFGYDSYAPYEAFVCDDIHTTPDFREIPAVGFFTQEVKFPVVRQNHHEWMAVKPNEIATMRQAIEAVAGKVITFGLGLGYFAFMAASKPSVSQVVVVERDNTLIRLFQQYLLPQFSHAAKITIVCADAMDYLQNRLPRTEPCDLFIDLWHDVSDGFPQYVLYKMKESEFPYVKFNYWIEESLRSAARWQWAEQQLLNKPM